MMRKGSHLTDEQKAKQREAHRGQKPSDETRAKLSAAGKRRFENPAERARLGDFSRGHVTSEETKKKLSEAARLRYQDPAMRAKTAESLRGLKRPFRPKSDEHKQRIGDALRGVAKSPEHAAKAREALRHVWENRELRERWARANFAVRALTPNHSELTLRTVLDRLFPGVYRFNDFAFTVYGKIPDFVDEQGKRLIDLYGAYWHRDADPSERVSLFASCGYRAIVVWDYELLDEPVLVARLRAFHLLVTEPSEV